MKGTIRIWAAFGFAGAAALLLGLRAAAAGRLGAGSSDAPQRGQPGFTVEPFTLKAADGAPWSLADAGAAKATVVLFLGAACPLNNAVLPRLAEIHQRFAKEGVRFVGLNANSQESPKEVAAHAQEHKLPFPVLKDVGNLIADRFAAERTPEAYLLDAQFVIRYRGRIDDQNGIGFRRPAPTRNDLAVALEELLAGKPISQPSTQSVGCLIGRTPKPKADANVTFAQHVAPILQKHCQECHRPNQIGPMSLLTYEDAAGWAPMICEVVESRRMPPWHADPAHGKFSNDRRLTDLERKLLVSWADQGCPPGDLAKAPKNPDYPEGWRIGKPDLILEMKDAYEVPAKAPPWGIPYQYFIVENNFPEDRWVQAVEAKPGNKGVVHHIIAYVRERGKGRDRTDGIGDGMLVAFAPGDLPGIFEPGLAKKIPKGAVIYFQMHYTPNGVAGSDRSAIGIKFAKEPPKHEVKTRSVQNTRFAIPPGAANHVVEASNVFKKDAVLLSFSPHMHLRGKSFEYRVVFPDGNRETLLSVPKYDFNWQTHYKLAQPLKLPAGTRIECTAAFDNSADNPNNPNPKTEVRWGDQTWEEMMIGFLDYYYVEPAKTKAE